MPTAIVRQETARGQLSTHIREGPSGRGRAAKCASRRCRGCSGCRARSTKPRLCIRAQAPTSRELLQARLRARCTARALPPPWSPDEPHKEPPLAAPAAPFGRADASGRCSGDTCRPEPSPSLAPRSPRATASSAPFVLSGLLLMGHICAGNSNAHVPSLADLGPSGVLRDRLCAEKANFGELTVQD